MHAFKQPTTQLGRQAMLSIAYCRLAAKVAGVVTPEMRATLKAEAERLVPPLKENPMNDKPKVPQIPAAPLTFKRGDTVRIIDPNTVWRDNVGHVVAVRGGGKSKQPFSYRVSFNEDTLAEYFHPDQLELAPAPESHEASESADVPAEAAKAEPQAEAAAGDEQVISIEEAVQDAPVFSETPQTEAEKIAAGLAADLVAARRELGKALSNLDVEREANHSLIQLNRDLVESEAQLISERNAEQSRNEGLIRELNELRQQLGTLRAAQSLRVNGNAPAPTETYWFCERIETPESRVTAGKALDTLRNEHGWQLAVERIIESEHGIAHIARLERAVPVPTGDKPAEDTPAESAKPGNVIDMPDATPGDELSAKISTAAVRAAWGNGGIRRVGGER